MTSTNHPVRPFIPGVPRYDGSPDGAAHDCVVDRPARIDDGVRTEMRIVMADLRPALDSRESVANRALSSSFVRLTMTPIWRQ